MKKKLWICMIMFVLIPGLLFTVSCASKKVDPGAMSDEEKARLAAEQAEKERKLKEQQLAEEAAKRAVENARNQFLSDHVYFAFDSSALDNNAQMSLNAKAAWLQENPGVSVLITGNCDERGTVEYNLALGDRRAMSCKEYLINLGADAGKIGTVSYGEERPLDPAQTEEAWAKNRNCQFSIE